MSKLLFVFILLLVLALGAIAEGANPDGSVANSKFKPGDRVWTTTDLKVRSDPGLASTQIDSMADGNPMIKGNTGTVLDDPVSKDDYTWWNISYDIGITGWSAEKYLELVPDGPKKPDDFAQWSDDAIKWATDKDRMGSNNWNRECLRFVSNAFRQKDAAGESGYSSATNAARNLYRFNQDQGGWQHAPRGAAIFFDAKGSNPDGHVGIYLGDGKNIINAYGTVQEIAIEDATAKGDVGKYLGWSYPPEAWRPETSSKSQSTQQTDTKPSTASAASAIEESTTPNNIQLTLNVNCGCLSGPSIEGARVTGQDNAGNLFDKITDAKGTVTISGVSGNWQFAISKEGYKSNTWTMSVQKTDTKYATLLNSDDTWRSRCNTGELLSNHELALLVKKKFPEGIIPNTNEEIRVVAYAVAKAESSGNPAVCGDSTLGDSIGLWQINLCWNPKYKNDVAAIFNPDHNADAALDISKNGLDWTPWSSWKNGKYQNFLKEAKEELNRTSEITATDGASLATVSPTIQPNPNSPSIASSQPTKQSITLTLYVHEGDAKGPIISGAQVTGQDGSSNRFEQITDSNGYVTITGDPGTWSFKASAGGYATNSWDQEITETCTKHAFLQKAESNLETGLADDVNANITALKDKDSSVRIEAIKSLGKIADAGAVDSLIAALNDEDRDVRTQAAWALGEINDARAVDPLSYTSVKDADGYVREEAKSVLQKNTVGGNKVDARSVNPIIGALKDADQGVRYRAAQALGQIKNATAVDSLIAALNDEDRDVRTQAAWALGEIDDARAVDPLSYTSVKDADGYVREEAKNALKKLGS